MIMLTLTEFVLQQLGRYFQLIRSNAFLELQFISQGKIQPQEIFDVIGDRMVTVADNPAHIPPDLQFPDDLYRISDQGNRLHYMDQLRKSPALQQSGYFLRLDIIAFRLRKDVLQLFFKPELLRCRLDEVPLQQYIIHIENDHLLRLL